MTGGRLLGIWLHTLAGIPVAVAQPCRSPAGTVCLPEADLEKFVALARERKCLDTESPSFQVDRIVVVTDSDGRVFHSGADPRKPYQLTMRWCHLTVEAEGTVEVVAAMATPETMGFRFRPKAYLSYLPLKVSKRDFNEGLDAGVLLDVGHYEWANFNLAFGFRSVGAGVGFDLTANFGLYAGYGLGWTYPLHNVNGGIYFAF